MPAAPIASPLDLPGLVLWVDGVTADGRAVVKVDRVGLSRLRNAPTSEQRAACIAYLKAKWQQPTD